MEKGIPSRLQSCQELRLLPKCKEISGRSYTYKVLWGSWSQYFIEDNLLYRKRPLPSEEEDIEPYAPGQEPERIIQLVLPKVLRRSVFDMLHRTVFGGHTGERKTLGKLRQRFYWPRMSTEVKLWIRQCDKCQANKPLLRHTHGCLHMHVMGLPNERTAADVGGPLQLRQEGINMS